MPSGYAANLIIKINEEEPVRRPCRTANVEDFASLNIRYMFRRHSAAPGFRSPRSLRSHGSLHLHFARPGLASQALIRAVKPLYTLHVIRHLP